MAQILSHPLRLGPGGGLATVEQGSEQSLAEQLAVFLLTKKEERALVPAFGVRDPTFHELDQEEVNLGLSVFGPPVQVSAIEANIKADGSAEVKVTYAES